MKTDWLPQSVKPMECDVGCHRTWYIDGLLMTRWGGSVKQFFNRVNAIGTSMFVLMEKEQINGSIIYDARCPVVSAPRSGRWKAASILSWKIAHPKRRTKGNWRIASWYDQTLGETEMFDGTIRIARSRPIRSDIRRDWNVWWDNPNCAIAGKNYKRSLRSRRVNSTWTLF